MDLANDYNVDGSLLGLGEFILLQILCEMEIPQDAQQFVILCRKTFKLLIHPRFARIIQSIKEFCAITIDPIIREGIVKIQVMFENTGKYHRSIGIADAACTFTPGKALTDDGRFFLRVRYDVGLRRSFGFNYAAQTLLLRHSF
ncbi:MAG: hypothetical protein EZS28_040598 [Streblomastix strix]|uniref:Uncharacterized protein n=1 Tax=Streblomastix strix TaxID=222440 RepID=A0A5J4U2M2_9EUKA|nr:MAG: hypothetical protein EZS28_040598 [Streblomastix strix]